MIAKSLNKKAQVLGTQYFMGEREASSYQDKVYRYAKEVREIDLVQRCEQPDKVAYSIWAKKWLGRGVSSLE